MTKRKTSQRYKGWNWGELDISKGALAKIAEGLCAQGANVILEQMKQDVKLKISPFDGWIIELDFYDFDSDAPFLESSAPLEENLLEAIDEYAGEEELLEIEGILSRALVAIQERRKREAQQDALDAIYGPPAPPEGMVWRGGHWQEA